MENQISNYFWQLTWTIHKVTSKILCGVAQAGQTTEHGLWVDALPLARLGASVTGPLAV